MPNVMEDDDWRGYVKLSPGTDLRRLVRLVFEMGDTGGMGLINYKPGELPEATLDSILALGTHDDVEAHRSPLKAGYVLDLDYIHGRRVKFALRQGPSGHYFIYHRWPHHEERDLASLMRAIGEVGSIEEGLERVRDAQAQGAQKVADEEMDTDLSNERAARAVEAAGGEITAPDSDEYQAIPEDDPRQELYNDLFVSSLLGPEGYVEADRKPYPQGDTYRLTDAGRRFLSGGSKEQPNGA